MDPAIIIAVLVIGFAAGLRALTAPAVIAWIAYLGYIDLQTTSFSFMSSAIAVGIFSTLAIAEFVGDLLPNTPARTAVPGLIARVLTGSFSAACLLAAATQPMGYCVLGGIAAVAGAFTGFYARTGIVERTGSRDELVAIPEDAIAVCMAIAAMVLL